MITKIIQQSDIQVIDEPVDWKEAIAISLEPMIEKGCVESRYIECVIQNTLHFGPYFIITPDTALIHGRPEQGSKQAGMAMTLFQNPIVFPEDNSLVRLFISMSALDNDSHMEDMRALSVILLDDDCIQEILEAKTPADIFQILQSAETKSCEN